MLGTDGIRQNMVGHGGLPVVQSALSCYPYAGDWWKLLQAWIEEGVGWVIGHLRCDLKTAAKNRQTAVIDREIQKNPN